jgi:hypothetical protein
MCGCERGDMSTGVELAQTVRSMRSMVPAKSFEISKRFYIDLGFQARSLTDNLVEMRLGAHAFVRQGYHVQQWADQRPFEKGCGVIGGGDSSLGCGPERAVAGWPTSPAGRSVIPLI